MSNEVEIRFRRVRFMLPPLVMVGAGLLALIASFCIVWFLQGRDMAFTLCACIISMAWCTVGGGFLAYHQRARSEAFKGLSSKLEPLKIALPIFDVAEVRRLGPKLATKVTDDVTAFNDRLERMIRLYVNTEILMDTPERMEDKAGAFTDTVEYEEWLRKRGHLLNYIGRLRNSDAVHVTPVEKKIGYLQTVIN